MDIGLAQLGSEIDLGERPPPSAPEDPGKYFLVNRLNYIWQTTFSGKIHLFTEKITALPGALGGILPGTARRSYKANPSGEQFLHHALLEAAGLGELGFQRGDLGVHVGEDGGDGGLFMPRFRHVKLERK